MKLEIHRALGSAAIVLAAITVISFGHSRIQAQAPPPPDAPDVVDFSRLLPLLPEAPAEWTADPADGSTSDVGGFKLTNVHRDYKKGEGDNAPTASISILDSISNPDYVIATTAAWKINSEASDGYSKSVEVDGNPGFEAFETETVNVSNSEGKARTIQRKHATLWVMVARRYFVQIELEDRDPKELQDWIKRVDLKKLAEIK